IQPYKRPRIEQVTPPGEAHEKELQQKLDEVFRQRDKHYERTLATARARTSDYLVQVATTEPDISETSIFFLSLLPEQLRPQITYRWRKLIARRGYAEDPVFGPWSDLLKDRKLRADEWRRRGVDPRVIAGLIEAAPQTPAEVATAYGRILRGVGDNERALRRQLSQTESSISSLKGGAINLADVVAGGNGFGGGERGGGIHPVTGKATSGETGFIDVAEHDRLVAVPDNPFVDGVFTPKSKLCVVSSTGLQIDDLTPTGGQTWDYFKFGPSSGFTVNTIDGVDYNTEPQTMVAMHANKGITFDLAALRASHEFADSRCKALLGNGGAKDQSQLNFAAYVDGKRVVDIRDLRAQQEGAAIDIALPEAARFLTLVVTEGKQGVSHDQAILGDPRIEPGQDPRTTAKRAAKLKSLEERRTELQQQLASHLESLRGDPLSELLNSPNGPVWFPVTDIYYYLSRKDKDAFRGLVNQLDSISVKHRDAA
ncbi:MAG: NPCBM/NEW2 domain-containing protein, partial [Pirellulaceae bacterium]|nr:NPCBM/NEW2 domain-containing protein [Pirellulaceae bacterium]